MGWKYTRIHFNQIYVICGLLGKKATYKDDNSILFGINDIIINNFDRIYLKLENVFTLTYSEITTGKRFTLKSDDNSKYGLVSQDKACKTYSSSDINYYDVEDNKDIIKFFDKLKKLDLFDEYVKAVELLFKNIEEHRLSVINGNGRVEDSVSVNEYVKGVTFDANRSRELKNKK